MFPLLISAALLFGQLPTSVPKPDAVLARVNGVDITASQVQPALWDWYGYQAIEELVNFQLIEGEAAKQKVEIKDQDVQNRVDLELVKVKESVPAGQDLDVVLRQQGMTRSRLAMRVRIDLLLSKLAEVGFKPEKYIQASTIAIKPKSDAAVDVAAAIKKVSDAYVRLSKGEAWATVLKATSTDAMLVERKGFLDWVSIDAFPATTQKEIATLKLHGITNPVQTPNGIQLFRIDAFGASTKGAELESLKTRALGRVKQEIYQNLTKTAKIERLPY